MDAITSNSSLQTLQAMNVKMLRASMALMKAAEQLTEPTEPENNAVASSHQGRIIDISA